MLLTIIAEIINFDVLWLYYGVFFGGASASPCRSSGVISLDSVTIDCLAMFLNSFW